MKSDNPKVFYEFYDIDNIYIYIFSIT